MADGGASAAATPSFVLDALKHVDPMPGPIWKDRYFAAAIGDSHMSSTELQGHDQKKGGDMAALLAVLAFLAEQTRDGKQEQLAAVGFTDDDRRALDKVIGIVQTAVSLAKAMAAVNTPDQFATFLFQLKSALRNMAPTEKLLLLGGWRNMDGGHSVVHVVERDEQGLYAFSVHNAGKGVQYHPSSVSSHPKTKYLTSLRFSGLSADKMLDDAFWYMLMKMNVSMSDDHRCEVLYDVLLPHLLDCAVGVAIEREAKCNPAAAARQEFRTAQRSEINLLKSSKEAFRFLLREEGVSAAKCKHLSFLMRSQLIDLTARDLSEVETLTEADAKLLRLACQKLARAATKESESVPARLDASGMEEVWAQLQWAESQISAKLAARPSIPLLDMDLKATFEPFAHFGLFRRLESVEPFAGAKAKGKDNDLIDFLALPAKSSDIKHFGDVLKALVCAHSLCERLSAQSTSASYFYRVALIQDFFTHILPRPLPPFRTRKSTVDAAGNTVPPAECLYATAVIDYQTQLQVLNLLLELSKHYVSSAKSVSGHRTFESSHAVVMATIVAVTDAVLRIPACDNTSIVTLVLNGTESRAKPKSKQFASPYNNLASRGLHQTIAQHQATLGRFFGTGAGVPAAASSSGARVLQPSRPGMPTIEVIVSSSSSTASSSSAAASTAPAASTVAGSSSSTAVPSTAVPATGESASSSLSAASSSSADASASAGSSSSTSTDASISATAGAASGTATLDPATQAQLAEAQRLLSEALSQLSKAKETEQSQMAAAAASSSVAPVFFASLQNGRGAELVELSEKLLLTQPSLAQARGEVLEYFASQSEVCTKAIFNLPTKMNCSTYFGKDSPTLELVKTLCQMLGYELNPDQDEKDQSMDDQVSFIEAATWYLTHPKSPFAEHQPELFVYRDIVALYKIMVSQTDHRRSIKVHRWSTADVALKWRVKEVNKARTMIDINIELCGEEAVCMDALPVTSAADASSYITDVAMPTEDDCLHCLTLPSFGDVLSEEDSELLLSYLTAPYIRLPLVLSFFSTKDRVAVLLNADVQNCVESVLFEPRTWVSEYETPAVQSIPAQSRTVLGAPRGLLLNELIHQPFTLLSSLLQMARLALDLNTGDYTSSSRGIILFVVRLLVRVEAYVVFVLDHPDEAFRNQRQPSEEYLRQLQDSRDAMRALMLGPVRTCMLEWLDAAGLAQDLVACCTFHAHLAMLYRGTRTHEWDVHSTSAILQHSAFLRTWVSLGGSDDTHYGDAGYSGDNFFSSNVHGMATRYGMSHMGRFGGRGGGMLGRMGMGGRFGGMGGRGLGDDEAREDEEEERGVVASRRRGGKSSRPAGKRKGKDKEKGADGSGDKAEDKRVRAAGEEAATDSDSDADLDDVQLPGLGEEVAVAELKAKNPGENKAGDKPVLELPDAELFELLQYTRRGYVGWLATAKGHDLDDVLQGCLAASTRSPGVVSRGWRLISATPGIWLSSNADLELNAQTAELYFKHSTVEPVPNFISQTADYVQLFGKNPKHCALVASHDHRHWVRMVGQAYSLKRWDRVEPELVCVNQPTPNAAPNRPDVQWHCWLCGEGNPLAAEACKCGKRERPKNPHGFRFEDEQFSRMYVPVPALMQQHEKWIFEAVEPVLQAIYGGRGKMAWELYLPSSFTAADAQHVRLLGKDDSNTYREYHCHRARGVTQVYSLLEHGRRVFRSLDYSSDSRYAMRYLNPNTKDRAFPWHPAVRHAAGRMVPAFWDASLVITRDRRNDFGQMEEETFVPSRFLYGLLPSALLDHFLFWQRADDSLVAFPKDRKNPTFFYKLVIRLLPLPDSNGQPNFSAVVTRIKLDPATLDMEDPRAVDGEAGNTFEMSKQISADDPLQQAINASKVATLKEQGLSEEGATQLLKRFDYDLAVAQAWMADQTNAAELAALKSGAPAAASAAAGSAQLNIGGGAASGKHPHLLLLNLLQAKPGSLLHRVGTLLSRVEDLSNILCWSNSAVSAVGDEVSVSLIELPRLKLKLQPRLHVDHAGKQSVRLYSLDHANLFVSDQRDALLDELLDGLSTALLFENNERELSVLLPNYMLHRPNITAEPFSSELVPERGAQEWLDSQDSRFFLYPVHSSHTFLLTPTLSSALYLILVRLLCRQYTAAFSLALSCEADMKLSGSEEWVLQQLEKAAVDVHPNAAAIRLKISLVMMHSSCPWPWRVQEEFCSYLEKLNSVSSVCRLGVDEEIYLLRHLQSGAEFEDLEQDDAAEDSELNAAPRHLDTPLANRLAVLAAMVQDEESYKQESRGLTAEAAARNALPVLTRTLSGRKQVPLQKPVQRGCKNLWQDVESAVDRYFADFSFNSRTWDAQIEYARPDQSNTLLGGAIKTLNGIWKDTICGAGRKMGFFFLVELLTRQVDICLTDPGASSAPSLAKLFSRLLLLKCTGMGVRINDLAVHRSYRERSFVPFVVLALLERQPASIARAAPKMPFEHHRADFINGSSVSNKEIEITPPGRYLETLLQFVQQFVRDPKRVNDPQFAVHVASESERVVVPPLESLLIAPQPSDFACSSRRLFPFAYEDHEVQLSEADCACFRDQLLSCIALDQYVALVSTPAAAHVSSSVPFDVSTHPDAQSHVAKALLKRTHDDVQVYAQQVNEAVTPKIRCLLDDTLARITQLHAAGAFVHNDPALTAEITSAIDVLNGLVTALEAVAEQDKAQIPACVAAVQLLGNEVSFDDEPADDAAGDDAPMADAGADTGLSRMQFLLRRYSELRPSTTLDYLCASLLSTQLAHDIRQVNPFLPSGSSEKLVNVVQAFLFRVSRLGHAHRCIAMAVELIGALRGLSALHKTGAEGINERVVAHKSLTFKSSALAAALVTRRFCFGPNAIILSPSASSASGAAGSSAAAAPSIGTDCFEPRYCVFEYLFNILLRNQQVRLLHSFRTSNNNAAVNQLIMGAGKTTVIGPLLALLLSDGERLVTQVVPSALLEFSRSVLRSRFCHLIPKRIHTFSFDRSVGQLRHVTRLFDKLNAARKTKGIVITTPESIKALFLRHVELLHLMESAPPSLSAPAQLRLRLRSALADALSSILQLWRRGALILDEVDLLLHPLKSELNFPVLEKVPLDLSPDRWELAVHLLDAVFFAGTGQLSVPFGQSEVARAVLQEIKEAVAEGVAEHAIQSSPHLVLLSPAFYAARLLPLLAQWLLLWLRSKQHVSVRVEEAPLLTFLVQGPLFAPPDVVSAVRAAHSATQRKMLHLSHDWLTSFLPHCLQKINRVSFGLLTAADMQLVDRHMPASRKLMAVPFVGKDVPSHASEFSHMDVLIGLTILAYRYEGMRRADVRRVVAALQRQMRNQVGPFSTRPAAVLFESWCHKGKAFAQLLHKKQMADEEAEARNLASPSGNEDSKMSDAVSPSPSPSPAAPAASVAPSRSSRKLRLTPVVPLSIFQLSDRQQMRALYTRVRHLPDMIHYALCQMIFPAVLQHQTTKLSASGQELGGSLLFQSRYGFSGTPSDLLPLECGSCGYELGSEGQILTTLTDPAIVSTLVKEEWSVRALLSEVARMKAHALIDTGALITGYSNEEVARYLLEHGLENMDGVVFLDRLDRQMILLRASWTVLPLAQCGIDPSRRFTFYDQVHTTGMDIRQALNAVAVVTLGKDMTMRDFAQGAFRMRGIGKGQTICLYIIPEVKRLIEAESRAAARISGSDQEAALISGVAAWLTCNSMRSERLQFMALQSQSLRNIWRKRAHAVLLADTSVPLHSDGPVDSRRHWRFQEVHTAEMLHARRCIQTFREQLDFSVPADITSARTFGAILQEELSANEDLILGDEQAWQDVRHIQALAGSVGHSTEMAERALQAEMVQEQEKEQSQKKEVEQEEQSQVRFSREDETQRSWPIYELARFAASGASGQQPRSASAALSSLSLSASATVKDSHPFYPFSEFSVRGVRERDISMPPHLMLSSNWFRKEWAAMGQRRLKNVVVVLEWQTQAAASAVSPTVAGSSAAAASAVPPPESSSSTALSSSPLLNSAQETSLRTAFRMFATADDASGGDSNADSTGADAVAPQTLPVAQLRRMFREIGEELSPDDLRSLGDADGGAQTLSFDQFREFVQARSANRSGGSGRCFIAISLKEAESLRRLIHTQHPLLAVATGGAHQVSIGLRLLGGALLDASPGYTPAATGPQALALQSLRFINNEFFFNDQQLSLLLKSLQANKPVTRLAFFENLLRCRRRDRRRHNDTPLSALFRLADEYELLSYRAKVARVRFCLKGLSLSLQDAFVKFDAQGDTFLNTTELAYALLEYLRLPLRMQDVQQIMEFANKKADGLLSLDEFTDLLREPESSADSSAQQLAAETEQPRMSDDDEEDEDADMPPASSSSLTLRRAVSSTRLTLSPAYEKLYEEEEAERRRRAEQAEAEAAMALADKLAREVEQQQLAEQQARDWEFIQAQRKAAAAEELWSCPACTFKNEPTAHFCVVCESKRPDAQEERKSEAQQLSELDESASAGPAFWVCATCSYNNDAGDKSCAMCNAQKPKVTSQKQKKIVSLWACPLCTRLVTSDKTSCDVCSSDREAIRSAAPAPAAGDANDLAAVLGSSLIGKGGVPVSAESLKGKVVALYFSAHWCGPCRQFTPQLSSIYRGAQAAGHPFEVVFVSADRDVDAFNSYFSTMPWLAVKFSDEELRKRLSEQHAVTGIPALIIIDAGGCVITNSGRADVARLGDAAVPDWISRAHKH